MNKKPNHIKVRHEAKSSRSDSEPKRKINLPVREPGTVDSVLILRLVIATVIFSVSLIVKMPDFVGVLLLIIAGVAAGFDIALAGLKAAEEQDFFATPIIVAVVAVIAYVIGFAAEGAALLILYQIGQLLLAYAGDRTKKSALELLRYQDEEVVAKVSELAKDKKSGYMAIETTMRESSGSVLKLAMIFALAYALVLPLFTSYSFSVSIHRAITVLLIATPMSVVAAMPLTGLMGLCYSAQQGVVYNSAKAMEDAGEANMAVFDKTGVFSAGEPKLLYVQSDLVDQATFMNFAAHAVYYSEQPVAKAIGSSYDQEYKLSVISDFAEIPGRGVKLKIGDAELVLATGDYFAERGVTVPESYEEGSQSFYMTLAGRYVGKAVISADINEELTGLASQMNEVGIRRCVLLTEDGKAESQRVAEELDFKEVYAECDTQKKLNFVSDNSKNTQNRILYVYSSGIEAHSAAAVDIRVSRKARYADAVVLPQNLANIPFSIQVSHRMKEIAVENAVFAFLIKALLIFLSLAGYCNLWFAIFLDMVAAIMTILNSIRVTKESVAASFQKGEAR